MIASAYTPVPVVPESFSSLPALSDSVPVAAEPSLTLLDRDHSILAFNERVLDWAYRPEVPLIERLRYLCIVSSNLDEFFEVRTAPHLIANAAGERKGNYTVESFERLAEVAHALVGRQYALYNDELMPTFASQGIHIISHGERNPAQRKWVHDYYEREVRPLLIPVGLDPAHPFPQVANKSLNFIVRLSGKDAFGRENPIAIVKVPRVLPRMVRMPAKVSGGKTLFVALSSIVRAHLSSMFPGREVGEFSQFRVTRHSDLAVDEEDVKNLRTALRQGLQHRHYGQAVRLEVSASCAESLASFLLAQFNLPPQALYRVHGPVNLARLTQLIDLLDEPQLRFPPYQAVLSGHADAGAVLLRAAAAGRCPDPPAFRELRRRAGLPARSGAGPAGARHQADHLPHRHRLRAHGPAARGRSPRQGGHGGGGAQGALRRGGQHQLGRDARIDRRPGRVRRGRPEDARQDAAGDAPRGQADAALRPPVHRQLQPAHGQALHRHQPPDRRPPADRRHGGGVRAHGEPEPAAQAPSHVDGAFRPAPQADRPHRRARCRGGCRRAGPHRCRR